MVSGVQTLEESNSLSKDEAKEYPAKYLEPGIYYFNKGEGSVTGQMVTGKATVTTDGDSTYYHFDDRGKAYTATIKDGCIYDVEGKRMNADSGSTNQLTTVEDIKGVNIVTKKVDGVYVTEDFGSFDVVIGSTGKVKKSGSVRINGESCVLSDIYTKRKHLPFDISSHYKYLRIMEETGNWKMLQDPHSRLNNIFFF